MFTSPKEILPDKINKVTIKLKSYAFMKIFMIQLQAQKKFHKIRHYDLQLQGAAAISSWMKKKLQQVYLRGFLEIKDTVPELVSLRYIKQPSSPTIQKLNFRNNQVKSATGKFRSQTDRSSYQKTKMPSYSTQQLLEKHPVNNTKVVYRSEYGGQVGGKSNKNNIKIHQSKNKHQDSSQSDDRKSNLMSLLDKVRKVNSQSKQDKQNVNQKHEQTYDFSYENSRVISSHSVYGVNDWRVGNNNSNNNMRNIKNANNNNDQHPQGKYLQQQTARINTVNHNNNNYNNDLSFCTYGNTQRINSINNLKSIRNNHYNNQTISNINIHQQRASQSYTPVTYDMNISHQQEQSLEKSNLMQLKRWNRNQKRNVIMTKINQLENSLMAADSYQPVNRREYQEYQFGNNYNNNVNDDDIYTSRDYYQMPANYSQGYLNMRTQRIPVRSVVDVRVRK